MQEQKPAQIPGAGFDMMNNIGDIDNKIKIQQKQVEIAELNIKSLKDNINSSQTQIKSAASGVVTGINGVEGGLASVGLPVITVEDTENIKAVLNVSQYDVLKLKEGQEAVVRLGGEQKEYKGRVDRINPTAKKVITGTSAETSIPVEISILNPDSSVKIGFDVDADVMVSSKNGVLYVPDEAVISDKDGNNSVYTVKNNCAVRKSIKLGLESDFYSEVLEGLSEGEKVILNPQAGLKDGSQVKVIN
jgi:HlyD family secretion protein